MLSLAIFSGNDNDHVRYPTWLLSLPAAATPLGWSRWRSQEGMRGATSAYSKKDRVRAFLCKPTQAAYSKESTLKSVFKKVCFRTSLVQQIRCPRVNANGTAQVFVRFQCICIGVNGPSKSNMSSKRGECRCWFLVWTFFSPKFPVQRTRHPECVPSLCSRSLIKREAKMTFCLFLFVIFLW